MEIKLWTRGQSMFDRNGFCSMILSFRAAPLVRGKTKFTVKNALGHSLRRQHTAVLTVNLTLTRTSGAALRHEVFVQYKGPVRTTIFCALPYLFASHRHLKVTLLANLSNKGAWRASTGRAARWKVVIGDGLKRPWRTLAAGDVTNSGCTGRDVQPQTASTRDLACRLRHFVLKRPWLARGLAALRAGMANLARSLLDCSHAVVTGRTGQAGGLRTLVLVHIGWTGLARRRLRLILKHAHWTFKCCAA